MSNRDKQRGSAQRRRRCADPLCLLLRRQFLPPPAPHQPVHSAARQGPTPANARQASGSSGAPARCASRPASDGGAAPPHVPPRHGGVPPTTGQIASGPTWPFPPPPKPTAFHRQRHHKATKATCGSGAVRGWQGRPSVAHLSYKDKRRNGTIGLDHLWGSPRPRHWAAADGMTKMVVPSAGDVLRKGQNRPQGTGREQSSRRHHRQGQKWAKLSPLAASRENRTRFDQNPLLDSRAFLTGSRSNPVRIFAKWPAGVIGTARTSGN